MARTIKLSIVLVLVLSSIGCRSRCGNCGSNNTFGGGLFQPVATTVPAPSTYSLQPGARTARQQDYYTIPNTGNVGQQPGVRQPTPLDPNGTNLNGTNPNGTNPNLSPQGWRQVLPNSSTQQFNNQQFNNQQFNNQQLTPTSLFVSNQAGPAAQPAQQINPNYQTTVVDERSDPTRLAVTDASAVRAPARFFPTGNLNRPPQTPVATTSFGTAGSGTSNQVAVYTQPQSNPTQISGSVIYQGPTPVPYGTNPYANQVANNFNRQARVFNPPVTSTAPQLLAQSTTERTASNVQAGWRNSQIPNNVNR